MLILMRQRITCGVHAFEGMGAPPFVCRPFIAHPLQTIDVAIYHSSAGSRQGDAMVPIPLEAVTGGIVFFASNRPRLALALCIPALED